MGTSAANAVAIIPARAGSKGLPRKNTRELHGKPLYRHSVDTALKAGINRIIISTDLEEIRHHDLPPEVQLLDRRTELAGDDTTMASVLIDLLPQLSLGEAPVVLLQPTSPLRTSATIGRGLARYDPETTSMVMSISPAERGVLKWGLLDAGRFVPLVKPEYCFANRQSLPQVVRPNGALYIFSARRFLDDGDFSAENVQALEVAEEEAIDIDTAADFERCERLLREGYST